MKYFFLLLHLPFYTAPVLANKIIIESDAIQRVYFPDLLIRHSFAEATFTLPSGHSAAACIENAFKKLPPHRIAVLSTPLSSSIKDAEIIQKFYRDWTAFHLPDFFTEAETAAINSVYHHLHLTKSQQIQLKKALVSCKWNHPEALLTLLYNQPSVSTKKERNNAFNELIKKLMD